MAAAESMQRSNRSAIWGLIALLGVLAVFRSFAPERTEKAVRQILEKHTLSAPTTNSANTEIAKLKEDLQRERAALEKWRKELERQQEQLDEAKATQTRADLETSKNASDSEDMLRDDSADKSGDVETKSKTVQPANVEEGSSGPDDHSVIADEVTKKTSEETTTTNGDEQVPILLEDECPTIVVPESTRAGLGTQINHLWSSLSLTLAIRNSCLVIPPVMANDGTDSFRPVPFNEVFDEDALAQTGLRFVPMRTCLQNGISTVFDDAGAESAIVKNFAAFVQESHPQLAQESTLVHADTTGFRFLNDSEINGDINVVARHIQSKLPSESLRHCVGIGRMRAEVEVNPDVLEHFEVASSVSEYVTEKFPNANETLFVKLRWNRAHCDKVRTENGTVCVFSDNIVPMEEYVYAIAHTATAAGVADIYISAPSHIADDVSAYVATHLRKMDPVILDVGGDVFTANVVERELAFRSKRFISDGGAWGESVLISRKKWFPLLFEQDVSTLQMIEAWKEGGWSKDSPFLISGDATQPENIAYNNSSTVAGETESAREDAQLVGAQPLVEEGESSSAVQSFAHYEEEPEGDRNVFPDQQEHISSDEDVPEVGNSETGVEAIGAAKGFSGNAETGAPVRPTEYTPPLHFVPSNDDDDEMKHFRSQSVPPNQAAVAAGTSTTGDVTVTTEQQPGSDISPEMANIDHVETSVNEDGVE